MPLATRSVRLTALAAIIIALSVLPSQFDAPVQAQGSGTPAMPTLVDTTYNAPSNVVNVASGANLQTAINNASLGTTLMLPAGASFGSINLPNKTGSGWIYIVSSGSLPAPGNRVTPANAGQMARIQVSTSAAITTAGGAHHYRFVGIEVSVTGTLQGAVVNLEGGSNQPHHIVLDRCYVHGTASGTHRRGVTMHGADLAVIDSYVADFKENGADSQAIVAWSGTGPLKIVNTFLSGAGENFMAGGADPNQAQAPGPSDLEFRGNHVYKPMSWRNANLTVKNLLELKNMRRALIEGNVFENNWAGAQTGFSIVFTPRNQDGSCPTCGTQDITFRRNLIVNVAQGFTISGDDDENPSTRTDRVLIEDNLMLLGSGLGGDGRAFQTTRGPSNVTINHNTVPTAGMSLMAENTPKAAGFVMTNNIVGGGGNGVGGTGTGTGTPTLNGHFTNWVFSANVIIPAVGSYPAGNFTSALGNVGFTSTSAPTNYTLLPGSPYKNAGTDGKDIGADIALVNQTTACAVSGQCAGGPGGGDITPPTAAMTAPVGGAVLTGSVTVSADADDDTGVVGVQFKANGANIGSEDTTAPYSINWNSASIADGAYSITAVARDAAGNSTTSTGVSVTVSNSGPVVSGVSASSLTATSATITWTTNQAADSQLDYGTTTAYGSSTTLDTALVTSHSEPLTGLAPATLYHYRVKSRNGQGQLTTSGDFTLSTVGPPVISGVSTTGTTATTATVAWTTNQASDSQIEYGLTTAYGSTTTLNAALVTSHNQTITGLTSNQTYHYRVRSANSFGQLSVSGDFTFVAVAAPAISGVTASAITGTTATIAWTTDQASDSQVDYGTTTNYGSSTALNTTGVTAHSQGLTGLSTGTLYHYRVKSRNPQGALATSGDFTFTTVAAPAISGVAVSNITGTTATISWTTNQQADSQIDYGTTTAYGSTSTLDSTLVTSHSQGLVGLTPGTTYQYRVRSRNSSSLLSTSSNASFTTTAAPAISGVNATAITGVSVTINWTTNQASDTQIEYGPTTAYGSQTTLVAAMVTGHSQAIAGLTNGTLYHYRVKSRNSVGLLATSGDFTFTTVAPPTISNVTSPNKTSTTATITWTTNQASDSQVEFGSTTAYGSLTPLDALMVTNHSRVITGLTAATTYQFRVRSRNSSGLLATSANFSVTTSNAQTQSFPVNVSRTGVGAGAVIAPVAGISCGATCAGSVNTGTSVVFTAIPEPGSRFAGWSGACSGSSLSCTVNVTGNTSVTANFGEATTGDFDGDGSADLVWQHQDGTLALWTMQGSALASSNYITPMVNAAGTDWQIIGPGGGSGGEDSGTGGTGGTGGPGGGGGFVHTGGGVGLLSAVYLTAQSRIVDLNWRIVATPDLNGDGKADLLWQHGVSGKLAAWSMDGAVKTFGAFLTPDTMDPSLGWTIRTTGDFNSDGKADIVWQRNTGALLVWFMNGTIKTGEQSLTPGTVSAQWRLSGGGDFNADGQTDFVWQNQSTGDTYLWLMNGMSMQQEIALGQPGAGWQVRAVGDYDADGRPDLVWQKTTGELAVWFMNGTSLRAVSALIPGAVDPAWVIVGVK